MSLFKTRDLWSTRVGQNEEFDFGALCVSDLDGSHRERLVVGSLQGCLRVYQPSSGGGRAEAGGGGVGGGGMRPDDVLCEVQLSAPIIQIEAGKFVVGSSNNHIAVLHPRKLSIYGFSTHSGKTEHGAQFQLNCMYEHKLQRVAFNFCCGPFGGTKGKDMLCLQSVDGTLTVFEQETFSFQRFLPGAVLPGPLAYCRRTDSFITVASSRQVESYKLQALAMASDKKETEGQNSNSGKRLVADWTFVVNELAIDIKVTSLSSGSGPSIFILGERNLYALTDVGQLCFMKKFDFNPSCFLPYAAASNGGGSVSGSSEAVLCAVVTHSKSLLIYQNTGLKWTAQLHYTPVQLRQINVGDQKGFLVSLDEEGRLQCFYLGTDPSVFSRPPIETREIDYVRANTEMEQLSKTIAQQQGRSWMPLPTESAEDELKLSVTLNSSLDSPSNSVDTMLTDEDDVPSISASIMVKCRTRLHNVKMFVNVVTPLTVNQSSHHFSIIEVNQATELKVTFYMKTKLIPTDMKAEVIAVYTTNSGSPRIVRSALVLPLLLIWKDYLPVKQATHKLTIDTNKPVVSLADLFSDMLNEQTETAVSAIGFKYYGHNVIVTILAGKNGQRYRVQSEEISFCWHAVNELVKRLKFHFRSSADFKITIEDNQLPLAPYFSIIDQHLQSRADEDGLCEKLEDRASQFRSVQKRLLTMFKDKTPAPLRGLDTLLEATYNEILEVADRVEVNKQLQKRLGAELYCCTQLICLMLTLQKDLTKDEYNLLLSALVPASALSAEPQDQGWEEVADASILHTMRSVMSGRGGGRDVMIMSSQSSLTRLKDGDKLKKHIVMLCDRIRRGMAATASPNSPTKQGDVKRSTDGGWELDEGEEEKGRGWMQVASPTRGKKGNRLSQVKEEQDSELASLNGGRVSGFENLPLANMSVTISADLRDETRLPSFMGNNGDKTELCVCIVCDLGVDSSLLSDSTLLTYGNDDDDEGGLLNRKEELEYGVDE